MNWFRNFWMGFTGIFRRNRSGWRGFDAVDSAHVDSPEEFRRNNDV